MPSIVNPRIRLRSAAAISRPLAPLGFHPSSIGKYNRRFDLSGGDRPVSPEQGVLLPVRDDCESVPPIKLDGPGPLYPRPSSTWLARRRRGVSKRLLPCPESPSPPTDPRLPPRPRI